MNKNVTVIVPVYGDWKSLNECLLSLIKYVAPKHKVLLINDCGPDAQMLEEKILDLVKGYPHFFYHRNNVNLGFVKTCNRGVFELDETGNDILLLNSDTEVTAGFLEEMVDVLYLIDRHGVVIPRSNNATLATVPFRQLQPERGRDDLGYSYAVWNEVKEKLPKYSVVPVGVGFCMLIRRTLIKDFGLFDEVFGKGYNEENDFCLRINKYGYSSVLANRSFVFHLESRSFTPELKSQLNQRNEVTLLERYPYYPQALQRYFNSWINPVDHFADVIAKKSPVQKVLINLLHFPAQYSGTTKNGISLLKYLQDNSLEWKEKGIEFSVLTNHDAENFHTLSKFGFAVVYPETLIGIYDLGFAPMQIFHLEILILLNRHCARIAFCLLDIISIRSQYLLNYDIKQRDAVFDSLISSDLIFTISDSTRKDVLAYYPEFAERLKDKITTVRLGYAGSPTAVEPKEESSTIRELLQQKLDVTRDFILVFGNDYNHKAIKETLPILEGTGKQYVVLGPKKLTSKSGSIIIIPSGNIPEDDIDWLLRSCKVVLFPSHYEGFGFPLMEAAFHRKNAVYYKSETGIEIAQLASPFIRAVGFDSFEGLPKAIEVAEAAGLPDSSLQKIRVLDDSNHDQVKLLLALLEKEIDVDFLLERWRRINTSAEYYGTSSSPTSLRAQIKTTAKYHLKRWPGAYRFAKRIHRMRS